jgi:hypothetical protein
VGKMSVVEELINPPENVSSEHDLSQFLCGEPALDDWLRRRALQNEESGTSRTYVVCVKNRVVGYYALAVGAVTHAEAPGGIRRNMPDSIPVMVIDLPSIRQLSARPSARPYCGTRYCVQCRPQTLRGSAPSWCTPFQNAQSASMRGGHRFADGTDDADDHRDRSPKSRAR